MTQVPVQDATWAVISPARRKDQSSVGIRVTAAIQWLTSLQLMNSEHGLTDCSDGGLSVHAF